MQLPSKRSDEFSFVMIVGRQHVVSVDSQLFPYYTRSILIRDVTPRQQFPIANLCGTMNLQSATVNNINNIGDDNNAWHPEYNVKNKNQHKPKKILRTVCFKGDLDPSSHLLMAWWWS
jgi:hypothetical protein